MSQYVFRDEGERENDMRQEYDTYHNYSGGLLASFIRDRQEWPCGLDQFLCCSSSLLPCPWGIQYKYI